MKPKRPILLGYQTRRVGTRPGDVWRGRRLLAAYAEQEGFRLGSVFVVDEVSGRGVLGSLLQAAADPEVAVVAVVSAVDLSRSARVQRLICELLRDRAGVEVRIVGHGLAQATILPVDSPEPLAAEVVSQTGIVDPSRVQVELVTTSDRTAVVEFRARLDTVEAWSLERLVAVFDRDLLRDWLSDPIGWIADGEVTFSVAMRAGGAARVAIGLPEVLTWVLSPTEEAALRGLV